VALPVADHHDATQTDVVTKGRDEPLSHEERRSAQAVETILAVGVGCVAAVIAGVVVARRPTRAGSRWEQGCLACSRFSCPPLGETSDLRFPRSTSFAPS
jgi:hypothetical protein